MIENRLGGITELGSSEIPSSTNFPIEIMKRYMPRRYYPGMYGVAGRGFVWDLGSGAGDKLEELSQAGFATQGFDLNKDGVDIATKKGLFADKGDVRIFSDGMKRAQMVWLEMINGIHMQALGPSMFGDEWKSVYRNADVALHPNGYVFVADYLRSDRVYSESISNGRSSVECETNSRKWTKRIEANWEAFSDLELEGVPFTYGTVAVAKPGRHKHGYDWSNDPIKLRRLYERRVESNDGPVFERFAQNVDPVEIEKFMLDNLGYYMRERRIVEWQSRAGHGEWYPGVLWVFQKPDTFRYHPWKSGLSPNEEGFWKKWKARKHQAPYLEHFTTYYNLLLENLARWDNPQPLIEKEAKFMTKDELEIRDRLSE